MFNIDTSILFKVGEGSNSDFGKKKNTNPDSNKMFSETDIIKKMFSYTKCLSCLVDSWYSYGYQLYSSSHRLYSYETDLMQELLKKNEKELAQSFNLHCMLYR